MWQRVIYFLIFFSGLSAQSFFYNYIDPCEQTRVKSTYSINQDEEGCLSIPGLMVSRERYDMIKVRYYNIEGKVQKTTLTGFLSKLFQHELDHLNGELMLDDVAKLENIFPIDTSDESVKKYQTLFSANFSIKWGCPMFSRFFIKRWQPLSDQSLF